MGINANSFGGPMFDLFPNLTSPNGNNTYNHQFLHALHDEWLKVHSTATIQKYHEDGHCLIVLHLKGIDSRPTFLM